MSHYVTDKFHRGKHIDRKYGLGEKGRGARAEKVKGAGDMERSLLC